MSGSGHGLVLVWVSRGVGLRARESPTVSLSYLLSRLSLSTLYLYSPLFCVVSHLFFLPCLSPSRFLCVFCSFSPVVPQTDIVSPFSALHPFGAFIFLGLSPLALVSFLSCLRCRALYMSCAHLLRGDQCAHGTSPCAHCTLLSKWAHDIYSARQQITTCAFGTDSDN
jgi:hypothetical protein